MPTNSLSTDWDKFYGMVMGEPEAEKPVRVTAEGLNVYQRPVVAIDNAGNPVFAAAAGPPQGTKNNRGYVPSADNSLSEPWPGAIDQTIMRNGATRRDIIQDIPAPRYEPETATIDATNPLDISRLGLTVGPPKSSAERAIIDATMIQPSGGLNRGRPRRGSIMVAAPNLANLEPDDPRVQQWLQQKPILSPALPVMRAAPAPEPAPVMRARPITYDQPRVNIPGTAGSVNGVDMAFMPISVQTSSRWRTGY